MFSNASYISCRTFAPITIKTHFGQSTLFHHINQRQQCTTVCGCFIMSDKNNFTVQYQVQTAEKDKVYLKSNQFLNDMMKLRCDCIYYKYQ